LDTGKTMAKLSNGQFSTFGEIQINVTKIKKNGKLDRETHEEYFQSLKDLSCTVSLPSWKN